MGVIIKQLSQNSKIIFPQTSAEAVLVKKGQQVVTLDKALQFKLESIETAPGSGLSSYQQGSTVIITHSNPSVTPNETPQPLLIQHDSKGHIIGTSPVKKLSVLINNQPLVESDGSEDKNIMFGDDFGVDNNNIVLKWKEIE